ASEAPATVSNTAYASNAAATTVNDTDSVAITRSVALTIKKTFADDSVNAGTGSHTFTIKVTNNGPSDAVGVNVTDTVDSRLNVTNVSDSGVGQACAASLGQSIDCTFDLANGADTTPTRPSSVGASEAPATVSNTAYASNA